MSYIEANPITWKVHYLLCDCGGMFEHVMNVNYADKPFVHACNVCGLQENTEHVYPRTVWEETK